MVIDHWKKEVCFKFVTKTLYWNKYLVSEYIFKLVYHCESSRWSEISCARDIAKKAKKSLNRLLQLLILKSSYPRCTIEKVFLKNFINLKGKRLSCCYFFLTKLQVWEPSTLLKRNSNAAVFQWNLRSF